MTFTRNLTRSFLGLALFFTLAVQCARADEPNATPLTVHNAEYEQYCGAASKDKHPCFTFWSGSMKDVAMSVSSDATASLDVKDVVLVKDANMLDFTIRPPFDYFEIHFRGTDGSRLRYNSHQTSPGCFELTLFGSADTKWRIWVSDETGNDRDLDTLHYTSTAKTFCDNKWIHIHVKRDGR